MQTRFTLRQLEYLVGVGRAGSISLAAEQLSVSPPSISNAIAQLEAEFGLPLFVRKHAQGMALTQSGRELAAQAAVVLDAAKTLSALADLSKGTVRGDLNLGCLLTFAQIVLPRLRRAYCDRYPEVRFHQFQAHQAGLIEALREARIDIALTYDLALPADMEFTQLASLPPFALLPANHPLANRPALSLADLAPLPMILLDLPISADYFAALFSAQGLSPQIVERTQDMAVMQSLVANDFGYSIANTLPQTNKAPDGKPLAFVPLTGGLKPMRMGLLTAQGGRASLTVAAFVDQARASLSPQVQAEISLRAP
jgi:DNA-binding transcriptional LysR family regulator